VYIPPAPSPRPNLYILCAHLMDFHVSFLHSLQYLAAVCWISHWAFRRLASALRLSDEPYPCETSIQNSFFFWDSVVKGPFYTSSPNLTFNSICFARWMHSNRMYTSSYYKILQMLLSCDTRISWVLLLLLLLLLHRPFTQKLLIVFFRTSWLIQGHCLQAGYSRFLAHSF
jgi:hypothetical protein